MEKDPALDRKKILNDLQSEELENFFRTYLQLKETLGASMKDKFQRSLPAPDLFFDRWEKAKSLGFGDGSSVYDSSYIFGNVIVGKNTWVGPFTILDGSGGLSIGDNCSISAGVQIYSHDSVDWAVSGGQKPYVYAATSIARHCYIGPNSIIAKGVELGEGCIVGANSFVNRSFEAGSKIAGSPAKIIS